MVYVAITARLSFPAVSPNTKVKSNKENLLVSPKISFPKPSKNADKAEPVKNATSPKPSKNTDKTEPMKDTTKATANSEVYHLTIFLVKADMSFLS